MPSDRAPCCLLVLCGLPGSGKSTVSRFLLDALSRTSDAVECVSVRFDDVEREHNTSTSLQDLAFEPSAWKASRVESLCRVRAALAEGPSKPGTRRLVVADDTMHLGSMRHECRQIARRGASRLVRTSCGGSSKRAAFALLWVRATPAVARRRNATREGSARVPDGSMDRLSAAFEAPDPRAESDCGQVLIVDTDTGTDTGADVDVIDGAPAFTVSRSCSRSEMPAVLKIAEGAAAAAAAAAAEGEVTVMTAGEAGASTAPNALWAALWAAWGAAEAPPLSAEEIEARAARDRAATAQSAMHSWDMRLRKAVSQHLETGRAAGMDAAALAKRLNAGRRTLLDELRRAASLADKSADSDICGLEEKLAGFEATGDC